MYKQSNMDELYGDNWFSTTLFYMRNMFQHTVPFLVTFSCIFMSDVVFLETDWYLIFCMTMWYTFTNWVTAKYAGVDQLYFMNWSF